MLRNQIIDFSGSAILGIAGAIFGACAPTTDEYKVLRNQLLNGVSEMFDNQQKADAMGCVYKIEFLTEIMKVQVRIFTRASLILDIKSVERYFRVLFPFWNCSKKYPFKAQPISSSAQ